MFLKTYSIAQSDVKLIFAAIALFIVGSLGLSAGFTGALADGPSVTVQGTTISWDFSAVSYTSTGEDDANGHVIHFCEQNATACVLPNTLIAYKMPAAGAMSYTADTVDNIARGPTDALVPLSEGTYRVQMVLWTNGVAAAVGNLLTLTLGEGGDPSQTTDRSPSRPPLDITFSGEISASQLLAGNRHFTFEGSNMKDVMAIRVNGKSLPMFKRTDTSFQVRLPKLGPGSYSVIFYTATDNWEIPGAIVIGELLPEVRKEEIQESFEKSSSELPKATKQEIRDIIEATPSLRKITVTAIAFREIVKENGNKLARARAESALDFIEKIDPDVIIETKLVYRGDTDMSSRGLVFRVAQKKN